MPMKGSGIRPTDRAAPGRGHGSSSGSKPAATAAHPTAIRIRVLWAHLYRRTTAEPDRSEEDAPQRVQRLAGVTEPAQHADDMAAGRVAGDDERLADGERATAQGQFLQQCQHRPDGVVATEVVVEPQLVDGGVRVGQCTQPGHRVLAGPVDQALAVVNEAPDVVDQDAEGLGHRRRGPRTRSPGSTSSMLAGVRSFMPADSRQQRTGRPCHRWERTSLMVMRSPVGNRRTWHRRTHPPPAEGFPVDGHAVLPDPGCAGVDEAEVRHAFDLASKLQEYRQVKAFGVTYIRDGD